eukprot:XP_008666672.1 vegetative cell wall protein gp1-like [Zea mays]
MAAWATLWTRRAAASAAAPPPLHLLSAVAVPPAVALAARALSASGAWAALADRRATLTQFAAPPSSGQQPSPPRRPGDCAPLGESAAPAQMPSPVRRAVSYAAPPIRRLPPLSPDSRGFRAHTPNYPAEDPAARQTTATEDPDACPPALTQPRLPAEHPVTRPPNATIHGCQPRFPAARQPNAAEDLARVPACPHPATIPRPTRVNCPRSPLTPAASARTRLTTQPRIPPPGKQPPPRIPTPARLPPLSHDSQPSIPSPARPTPRFTGAPRFRAAWQPNAAEDLARAPARPHPATIPRPTRASHAHVAHVMPARPPAAIPRKCRSLHAHVPLPTRTPVEHDPELSANQHHGADIN